MNTAGASAGAELRRDWQRWMRVVAYYAGRGWRRRALAPGEYEKLYRRLLAGCRALAAAADRDRELYQAAAELVRPWVLPRSLALTDRELLGDLWQRCRLLNRRLRGALPSRLHFRDWGGPVLALLGIVALAAAAYAVDNASELFGGRVRWVVETTWFALRGTDAAVRVGLLAIVVVVSLFALFRRALRR